MVDMSDERNYRSVLAARTASSDPAPDLGHALTDADDGGAPVIDLVRVEVEPDPAFVGAAGPADVLERFSTRVQELGEAVGAIAERLRATLEARLVPERSSRWQMSQVSMEFGLNLEAETGMVVVKGKTAAAFKVVLTWAQRDEDAAAP